MARRAGRLFDGWKRRPLVLLIGRFVLVAVALTAVWLARGVNGAALALALVALLAWLAWEWFAIVPARGLPSPVSETPAVSPTPLPRHEPPFEWMEHVPIPMYQKERSGAFIHVNAAWLALTGLQKEAVIGRMPDDIAGWEDDLRVRDFDAALFAGERRSVEFTRTIPRSGQPPINAVVTKRAMFDAAGNVVGIVGSVLDIEERLTSARLLREQKERMDLVVHASQSGIFDIHLPQGSAYVSPRLCAILGHSIDWQPGLHDLQAAVHPDDLAYVTARIKAHLARESDRVEVEYRHRCADGSFIHIEVHAVATFDDQGLAQRLTGSFMNVEDKYSALRDAAHQRTVVTNLLELNPNPIFMKSADGRWLVVNRAWEAMSGQSRDNVVGRFSKDFQRPEVAAANDAQDAELLASPTDYIQRRVVFRNRDGVEYDTIIAKRLLRSSDGRPEAIIGVITDLTEQRDLRRQLSLQSARMDHVIDVSRQGVWDRNLQTGTFWCTARFKEILGYAADADMSGYQLGPDIHPDDRERVVAGYERYLRGDTETFDEEFRRRRPNGDIIWIRSRARILHDESGPRSVGSIIDTSAERARETALREAKEQAEAAGLAKASFLSTMSHEIRTPLNGILGANSLLSTTPLSDEQHRFVDTIQTCGEALLSLISDILDFSRIESGRIELERRPVDLVRLVESTFEIVAPQARAKAIDLIADFDPALPTTVIGDEAKLRQVLLNLVGNSVKFTASGYVRVALHTELPAGEGDILLVAEVADTGIGIPPQARATLFEAFRQGDASIHRRYGGSGLGLAICRRLVESMGGQIDLVENHVGAGGSTFRFSVRLECDASPAHAVSRLNEIGAKQPRVLLVHPVAEVRAHFARILQHWDMEVQLASDASDAVRMATQQPFDVVLTDVTPGPLGSGWLVKNIVDSRGQRVPVVALTHLSASECQASLGPELTKFAGFILKPASRSQLFEGLQRVVVERNNGVAESDFELETVYHLKAGQRSILLVEDNAINQMIAREMLKRLGFSCDVATNGRQAVEAVLAGDYSVVLMDIQMPEMSGKDATRLISQQMPAENRPVIIALTAHAMAGDREECLAAGMDDYIAKPIRRETLAKAITSAFEKRRTNKSMGTDGQQPSLHTAASHNLLDFAQLTELRHLDSKPAGVTLAGLIERFERRCANALALLHALQTEASTEGMQRLAHEAHDLRGLSATLGARELAERLRRIERLAKEGDAEAVRLELTGIDALTSASLQAMRDWERALEP
jgi:PAS domain S-box-containing protein